MEHLPPVGWADVATKHDLDQQSVLTKHHLDAFRTEWKHDLDAFRTEWKHDLGVLRTELHHDLDEFRTEVRSELREGLARQATATEHLGLELRAEMAGLRGDTQAMMNRLLLQLLAAMLAFVTLVVLVAGIG